MILPVSQIWAFIVFSSTSIDLVANSTPIVLLLSKLNSFLVNLDRRFDFPTPLSPINTTEIELLKMRKRNDNKTKIK